MVTEPDSEVGRSYRVATLAGSALPLPLPFLSLPCPSLSTACLSYLLKLSTLSAAASLWVAAR